MDGENNGSNPIKMDDLGGLKPPYFFGSTPSSRFEVLASVFRVQQ